jgi:hypothetical protein
MPIVRCLLALSLVAVLPCGAQDTLALHPPRPDSAVIVDGAQPAPTRWHDPRTALVLGLVVPGGGYLYSGDWIIAYPTFAVTASSFLLGQLILTDRHEGLFGPPTESVPVQHQIAGAILLAGGVAIWIASARDASDRVRRRAEPIRLPIPRVRGPGELELTPLVQGSGGLHPSQRIGVNLSW